MVTRFQEIVPAHERRERHSVRDENKTSPDWTKPPEGGENPPKEVKDREKGVGATSSGVKKGRQSTYVGARRVWRQGQ